MSVQVVEQEALTDIVTCGQSFYFLILYAVKKKKCLIDGIYIIFDVPRIT